jgi:glycosyltransferase involved in cell wall biosynthesis
VETLNLFFVTDRCEPFYHGGYERHTWELARRLARLHRVTILTSMPERRCALDGVEFHRVALPLSYVRPGGGHDPKQSAYFGLTAPALMRGLRTADFVDVQGIPLSHLPGVRVRQAVERWRWGVTIWEAWWSYSYSSGSLAGFERSVIRSLLRFAVAGEHPVITGSEVTAVQLTRRYRVRRNRIRIVEPGVDLSAIRLANPCADHADVTFVGRLDRFKRPADLVEAVSILRKDFPHIHANIIGAGACKEELLGLIRRLEVGSSVHLLGYLPDSEVHSRLKASSCFVLASEREGFSVATLEAMACGAVPVVARFPLPESFGVGSLVSDGVTGRVFEGGSPEDLAEKLRGLLSDEAELRRMKERVKEFASTKDWDETARAYLRFLCST